MAKARTVRTHEDDLLALESITDCPAGMIDGFVIVLATTGGDWRIVTNACCVYHGIQHARWLADSHVDAIVPCHD